MGEQARIIGGFGVEDAAISRRGALARLGEMAGGAWTTPFLSAAVRAEAACDHGLSFGADRDAAFVGGEVAIELIVAGMSFVSKASAKAREFEKWCGQNEGDNSAPRMLKNRPAIVPLKTEV